MSLADQIAALPEWGHPYAALDRLALAREWVAQTHLNECSAGKWSLKTGRYEECDCGRAALLAALEPPK